MPWYASIRVKIAVLVVLPSLALFALFVWNTERLRDRLIIEIANDTVEVFAQTLNLALSPYTDSEESLAQIIPFLQELVGSDQGGIEYLALFDEEGQRLAATADTPSHFPPADADFHDLDGRKLLHIRRPILMGLSGVGELRYGISIRSIQQAGRRIFDENLRENLLMLGIMLGLIGVFAGLILLRLNNRLGSLVESSARITRGDYGLVLDERGRDEISQLARQMNVMAAVIRDRIAALEENDREIRALNDDLQLRSEELRSTLENLESAQASLIQAEKLAGLGSVVAAVAHELNTPVGNALTVSTGFVEKTRRFHEEVQQGLRKSVLTAYLDASLEAADIMQKNLGKAAELIQSFKHVAVDQTSSQRRRFRLHEVIEDVLVTLRPGIRNLAINVDTNLDANLEMDSYPGPLGQVLTNLFNNAVMHGFAERDSGRITITATASGADGVSILFSDNGLGMSKETRSRLFDPFFTTRLGEGGSGLGMHIVYNLVTGVLGGTIEAQSAVGEGTRFTLWLPVSPKAVKGDRGEVINASDA